ncbi:aminotransferase class I/II-fold pyridoxal phosphate-dependent enzyme [Streptomyces sp. NPDC056549]|uniref:aminotransferase class I/II-fold pyridoxal phosphate-dependent enzyme n=1 Tax=Streptomyces sp. NPDC056549 TaxID=3345864 RepID=UPI0036B63A51
MDQSRTPVLDALSGYYDSGQTPFTPPGHQQGRGVDPRVRAVLGDAVFRSDVLATSGLDDRTSSQGVVEAAQALMAEAVGAEHAFFSTYGSSLSVKSAMLSVAGPHEELAVGRDAHKSVVSGLLLSGIRPVWVDPQGDVDRHLAHPPTAAAFEEAPELPPWAMDAGADVCVTSAHKMGSGVEQSSVFHLQGDLVAPEVLKGREDLLGTTSPSVLVYAALDGWRRQMVEHGKALYDDAPALAARVRDRISRVDGLHVHGRADFCGPGKADDLDPLQIIVDISALGVTGYRAADWLRRDHRVNLHVSDHRRISAQLTHADDETTAASLLTALTDFAAHAPELRTGQPVHIPSPAALRLEQAVQPRDAFFGSAEQVPWERAEGRVAAEMLTPYPPGIPAAVPGERLTMDVLRYLRTGVEAGMALPDAVDTEAKSVRVLREEA